MIEQQFIEYVVKQLVDNPDAVKVEHVVDDRGTLLKLIVAPADLGRVIGKHGATAQSLRALLRALGTKNNSHYNLKIVDTDAEDVDETTKSAVEEVKTTPENDANDNIVEKVDTETVENESDLAKKTRAELADLDDFDI
ncbi:KH domain-containing protein [Candidatus Saccharibacteria bacterium]|nr:KH domain-containing protein [Candidatus Saccharibacteria bacterium]MCL1963338.1 KH domain-containing protein [Candidatus Saccharibacteria bacterium]